MALKDYLKDPGAVRAIPIDWSDVIGDDSITASVWDVPAGVVEQSNAISGAVTAITLSGGTAETDYLLVNRITFGSGQIDERTVRVCVRDL